MRLIHQGLDVSPILAQLDAASEMWSQYDDRTTRAETAHGETSDQWLRYFPRETLTGPAAYNQPGQCVFYPAWDRLPALHAVVWGLMASMRSVELGGILLTRLPPGGRILRHSDGEAWHARHFNCKCYVVLKANARCIVECDGDEQVYRPGEIFELNNLLPHSMENGGTTERLTAIICMRVEA